jgi:hypothetical protein
VEFTSELVAQLHPYFLDLVGDVENFKCARQVVLPKVLSIDEDVLPYLEERRRELLAEGYTDGIPTGPVGEDVVYRVLRCVLCACLRLVILCFMFRARGREQFPSLQKPLEEDWGGCPYCAQYHKERVGASTHAEKEQVEERHRLHTLLHTSARRGLARRTALASSRPERYLCLYWDYGRYIIYIYIYIVTSIV